MSDVVIIGAGPAGLTLGCYLARAGVSTLIVERGHHPRPHVGESLMPATVRILREIGFLPVMEAGHFPHSGGIVYHPASGDALAVAYSEFPQDGVDQEHTYHVDRAKFDMLLMKHAESLGCRIVEGVPFREVLFGSDGSARGIRVSVGDTEVELPARIVVDAAGRAGPIGRQLGLRVPHPVLDQFALHAWFDGVDRGDPRAERYTHVFLLPEVGGWAWMAAIDSDITSIGLVARRSIYQEAGGSIEDFFEASVNGHRGLARAMTGAVRLNEIKGEVNYSYRLDSVCGDGWLAIGDAAQFVDPVFSSGVSVAMHGARFASERIRTALDSNDVSRATFLPYERSLTAGSRVLDDVVQLFYRSPEAFTRLLGSEEHRSGLLRILQGEIGAAATGAVEAFRSEVGDEGATPS